MRWYLAARYGRREEMLRYAEQLRAAGHEVSSRWINGSHQIPDSEEDVSGEEAARFAKEDLEDMIDSDGIISFTEAPRSGVGNRGGRHVEFGFGLGLAVVTKAAGDMYGLVIIGHRENVFHWFPEAMFYPTWGEFLARLIVATNKANEAVGSADA